MIDPISFTVGFLVGGFAPVAVFNLLSRIMKGTDE